MHQQMHISGWRVQLGGQDLLCWSLSVLPSVSQLLHSPLSLQLSHSVPADLPVSQVSYQGEGTPPPPKLPPRCTSLVLIPFFFFFLPTQPCGDPSVTLILCDLVPVFSRHPVRTVPHEEASVMFLWEVECSMSPHSAILISSINGLYYVDISSLYTNFDESFYYE